MLRSRLLRAAARPPLLRAAAPLASRGLAGPSTPVLLSPDDPRLKGRTPERYAELEALAEKHNGFLFGEVVRRAPAPPRRIAARPPCD